jgi:thioredoxin 1
MKRIILLAIAFGLFATNGLAADLPKLIDVGADKCIPCIKMAPILDQLREDFTGQLEVKFVDAWKHREEAAGYGVRMIPTQIFYAPNGEELFRHTGFFGRKDILNKWRQLGYTFKD